MRTDELRAELRALAGAMAPFEADVLALHRRQRRRQGMQLAAAIIVLIGAIAGGIALANGGHRRSVQVSTTKHTTLADLQHVDFIVLPPSAATGKALDASALVNHYAPVTGITVPLTRGLPENLRDAGCALEREHGFAVDAAGFDVSRAELLAALGPDATVYDVRPAGGAQAEVFMTVDAPPADVALVRAGLAADPAIARFTFLDHRDAFEEFKRTFADQPGLIRSARPSNLPESFRLVFANGVDIEHAAARFRDLRSVQSVVVAGQVRTFWTDGAVVTPRSSCTSP